MAGPVGEGLKGGFASLFQAKLGPVPVWILVVGGGVAAAIFLPKFLPNLLGGGNADKGGGLGGSPGAPVGPPQPAIDPNIDPNTGVPYSVENAIDPESGLPVYLKLFGPAAPTAKGGTTVPGPQEMPASPIGGPVPNQSPRPGGGGLGGPEKMPASRVGPNGRPMPGGPQKMPAQPVGPTPEQNAREAIRLWEAHTKLKWTGPPGSFPAGWGPTGNAPGAGQIIAGKFHWVVPLPKLPPSPAGNPAGSPVEGRMPPQPIGPPYSPYGPYGRPYGSPGGPAGPYGNDPGGPASPYPGAYPYPGEYPGGPPQPWPPIRRY